MLECADIVHHRLQVLWVLHLDIHPDVLQKATNKELSSLACRDIRCVVGESLKAVGELLDGRGEGQPPVLS